MLASMMWVGISHGGVGMGVRGGIVGCSDFVGGWCLVVGGGEVGSALLWVGPMLGGGGRARRRRG